MGGGGGYCLAKLSSILDREGHAWVEFREAGLWAEATSGAVGRLGWGPSPYRAAPHVCAGHRVMAGDCS